jgi:hypothetical protein
MAKVMIHQLITLVFVAGVVCGLLLGRCTG